MTENNCVKCESAYTYTTPNNIVCRKCGHKERIIECPECHKRLRNDVVFSICVCGEIVDVKKIREQLEKTKP